MDASGGSLRSSGPGVAAARGFAGARISKKTYDAYVAILHHELIPAMGCTEPIAVALAAATARAALGKMPNRVVITCSANILKNVKGVTVPRTGGMKGVDAAALAGIVGGDSSRGLEVLEGLDTEGIREIQRLWDLGICKVELAEGVENLYVAVRASVEGEEAEVFMRGSHTGIYLIRKNGAVIHDSQDKGGDTDEGALAYDALNVHDILAFAECVDLEDIRGSISGQIRMNVAISDEGLKNHYGADVGKTLLNHYGNAVWIRARARAAAGSDARMGGCPLPVVINSGSGNQGMTVSLPVIEFAKELGVPDERLYRALVISNLVAIHQKKYIGKLSAYCGAVSAACGSGAGITYLYGGGLEEIARTITNTIANVGGIVCDGAKASCAAKIASAVDAALMAHYLSMEGKSFPSGEGLVGSDVETTIRNIGTLGAVGMKSTDIVVMKLMLGDQGDDRANTAR